MEEPAARLPAGVLKPALSVGGAVTFRPLKDFFVRDVEIFGFPPLDCADTSRFSNGNETARATMSKRRPLCLLKNIDEFPA
ncbi:MAG: hypothetical protein CMJ99_00935 [Planctomycetes bacterium]|nr:hypothetical protein [Planctomycetota bacterium]